MRDESKEYVVDTSGIHRFAAKTQNYFIAIEEKRVLADLPNPSDQRESQRIYILEINSYAYVVPYVENDEEIFLKTIFPSRKHTAIYLKNDDDE